MSVYTFVAILNYILLGLGTGNIVVIALIASDQKLRTVTNLYIAALCTCDVAYLGHLIPIAVQYARHNTWTLGSPACKSFYALETAAKYYSVLLIMMLAIDRYLATCQRDWCMRRRGYKMATLWLCVGAAAAAIGAAPVALAARLVEPPPLPIATNASKWAQQMHQSGAKCIVAWEHEWASKFYIGASFGLFYAAPLAVISFCYARVARKMKAATQARLRMGNSDFRALGPYRKVTNMVLVAVAFYLACWSPIWVYNMTAELIFRPRNLPKWSRIILITLHMLPYVNCAMNPVIYAFMTRPFRQKAREAMCHRFLRPHLCSGSMVSDAHSHTGSDLANKEVLRAAQNYGSAARLSGTTPRTTPKIKVSLPACPMQTVGYKLNAFHMKQSASTGADTSHRNETADVVTSTQKNECQPYRARFHSIFPLAEVASTGDSVDDDHDDDYVDDKSHCDPLMTISQ